MGTFSKSRPDSQIDSAGDSLIQFGWSEFFEKQLNTDDRASYVFGRVTEEQRNVYKVSLPGRGIILAKVAGKLRHEAKVRADLPACGDFVAIEASQADQEFAVIHRVLARRTKISRKEPGSASSEQIIATNVDRVLIVTSLNADLNLRRLERYVVLVWDSGATPVVVLTKADKCEDKEAAVTAVKQAVPGVGVLVSSSVSGEGVDELRSSVRVGETLALLGSSGVGKSTLVNRLLGEERKAVQETRESDDKGRHTTTYRELVPLPSGGLIMDTPGMRELGLWSDDGPSFEIFDDVDALAVSCRFSNCLHDSEPGCAIRDAIESGTLDAGRFESYRKLQKEAAYEQRRVDASARRAEKERWKKIAVAQRNAKNLKARS